MVGVGVGWGFLLSGVPDFFDRNKILSGGDLSHYQVPHCIRVFFYFVWLSGVPDYFDRNKISSGGDLSHYSSTSLY